MIQINDIVGRVSYGNDILFRVIDFREKNGTKQALLYGEEYRLIADSPFEDLVRIHKEERNSRHQETKELQEQSNRLFSQDLECSSKRMATNQVTGIVIVGIIFKYQVRYFM